MKIHGLHIKEETLALDNFSLNQRIVLLEATRTIDQLKKTIQAQEKRINAFSKTQACSQNESELLV